MKNFDEWNKVKKKIEHRSYIPPEVEVGQVYWFSFGLNVGKEIGGKNNNFTRPGLVFKIITKTSYLIIPLTSSEYYNDQWHLEITNSKGEKNLACFNQIKVMDYRRMKTLIFSLNEKDLSKVIDRFRFLYLESTVACATGDRYSALTQVQEHFNHSVSDKVVLSNKTLTPVLGAIDELQYIKIDKSNYEKYLHQLVKLDEKFNQVYIDNTFARFLTPKQNSDIDFKKFITEEINSDEEYFYEIMLDGSNKVVGYILCFLKDKSRFHTEEKIGYIDGVYVDDECRGRGFGTILINHAEEFCKSNDIFNISLNSEVKNTKAISLYKELGFVEQDVTMYKKII